MILLATLVKQMCERQVKPMALLMLRNTPIYDIAKGTILNKVFCPFPTDVKDPRKAYETWRDRRAYLKTNRAAEQVIQQLGGFHTRQAKRRLSLTDGYWIKYSYDDDTTFESITPYLNYFYEAQAVRGTVPSSVPELVIGGSQPKVWARGKDDTTFMRKVLLPEQVQAEMLAVKLIRKCSAKVMNAFVITDKGRLYAEDFSAMPNSQIGLINIVNMTNTERSMIPFDQIGIGVNGYDPVNVADCYTRAGVDESAKDIALVQVLFDAVTGNVDRRHNNSNWAVFMDNNTGKRTPSWSYDFNWSILAAEMHEIVDAVASCIVKAGIELTQQAVTDTTLIRDTCKELGLKTWYGNARRLLNHLER